MKQLNVLITAGPTREYIDPVRYISNDSSGLMGFALAAAAKKLGASVTLISGPVNIVPPKNVKQIKIISAKQMCKQTLKHSKVNDIVIMAAAVADYCPAKYSRQKIKKTSGQDEKSIRLRRNPDILEMLVRKKQKDQLIVGFAVESEKLEKNALKKLRTKKCDWIIANRHKVVGSEKGCVIMISKSGKRFVLPELPKGELAFVILSYLLDEK